MHSCRFPFLDCEGCDKCPSDLQKRVIDLDARHPPERPVLSNKAMLAIFAASLAFITFYAVSALVDRGMDNIADYRAAHAPV